jgi:AraC family transcriptional regulator, transcriptional activator of pobA
MGKMNRPVKIFRFGIEDANKVVSSENEPHIHDFEEIIIGMEGAIEHFIDFNAKIVNAPYACFVTKGKVHRVKPIVKDGKCDIWVIRFNSEFVAEIIFHLYASFHNKANIIWPMERVKGRIPALTEMMFKELEQPNPDFSVIRHLLNAVIALVMAEKKKQSDVDVSTTQNETFANFLSILEENFRRPVGVGFYAKKLFMSSRNLNLICQNILQQSVSEIIETRKLIEAKNLLSSTNLTIAEIGFELGYKEKAYFSNVFKKKAGQTPSAFRNEMKQLLS